MSLVCTMSQAPLPRNRPRHDARFRIYDGGRAGESWDYRWQGVAANPNRAVRYTRPGPCVAAFYGHSVLQTLMKAHYSPRRTTGRRYIYAGSFNGAVHIYDTHLLEVHHVFPAHSMVVRDCAWHPYLPMLVTASWDCSSGIWSSRT